MTLAIELWEAAGRPEPNWTGKARTPRPTPPQRWGTCALTGVKGPVVDARHVVSDLFTTWDRLRFRDIDPAGIGFGFAAAWTFRNREMLMYPHAYIDGAVDRVDPPGLFAALIALDRAGVVTVPVSMHKHTVPWAARGTVRTDDRTLTWDDDCKDLLICYQRLRHVGFGETALTEPVPRWAVLSQLDADTKQTVLALWPKLDRWRREPEYLAVAARATRQPKAKKEEPVGICADG